MHVIVKWNTVDCEPAGAVFSILIDPGANELVTVTVTVLFEATVNAPDGVMTGELNVDPGSSSVTVQLEPAGMSLCVTVPVPVIWTW